ncbi:MAG: dynamin family protein [Paracoccaceae bacterium]
MTQARLTPTAKPRIAIMGEFSAGKSTLCNLLLRARPLPEKVTATRLPPIWMSQAPGENHGVTLDGDSYPVDVNALDEIPFDKTRHVRLFFDADILDHCDFIDFPGISDPNMDAEVWERVLVEADAVLWLTHATQAWRQSEAAVWDTVPEEVQEKSVLLITRYDKLVTEQDKTRVLARVKKETDGLFEKVFPISLTDALDGFEDYDLWQSSGAADFTDHLVEMIAALGNSREKSVENQSDDESDAIQADPVIVRSVGPRAPGEEQERQPLRVIPRRVRPQGMMRRGRPGAISA